MSRLAKGAKGLDRPSADRAAVAERLREARAAAGWGSATAAAAAMGVKLPTYTHHENGTAGLSRTADRYARFFHVHLEWLLTGRGPMKNGQQPSSRVSVDGIVGAGARVSIVAEAARDIPDEIPLPDISYLGALIVEGNSQYPVFSDGEVILYDTRPMVPSKLVGELAVVQVDSGDRLLKTIRRGNSGTYNLESANAPLEEGVKLLAAFRYVGTLARPFSPKSETD